MTTKTIATNVLDYYLADEITLGEAISFYDSFHHPELVGLYNQSYREKEAKLLTKREGWLRSCIKDYNNPDVPSSAKEKTAEEVGRYFLNSALAYVGRLHADDVFIDADS